MDEKRMEPWQEQEPRKKGPSGCLIALIAAVVVLLILLIGMVVLFGLNFAAPTRGFGSRMDMDTPVEQWAERVEDQAEAIGEQVEQVLEQELTGAVDGFGYNYKDADRYTAGSGEVETRNINRLVIDWVAGSVTVEPWDGDTISLSETEVEEESHRLRWLQEGSTLTVRFCDSKAKGDVPEKTLTVKIPKDLTEDLDAVQVNTVSSDISVTGLGAAFLEFHGVSGSLSVDGYYRDMDIETVSGDLTFVGWTQNLEMETTSGDAELNLDQTPVELDFDSVSGSCSIFLPEYSHVNVEFESVSGRLENQFEPMWNEAAELDFETVSGDVVIAKK